MNGLILIVTNIALAFIVGMNIPLVSIVALGALFVVNLPNAVRYMKVASGDAICVAALAAFLSFYFGMSYYWDFISDQKAIGYAALVMVGYTSGLMLGDQYRRRSSYGLSGTVLGLATGFTVFAFLCVRDGVSESPTFLITGRTAPDFWAKSEIVNGTELGMFSALGLCMLPVAVLGSNEPQQRHGFYRVFLASLAAIGLFTNVVLQNRSPDVALGVSLVACSLFFYRRSRSNPQFRVGAMAFRLTPLALLAVVAVAFYPEFVTNILFARFGEQGMESERSEVWGLTISNLLNFPFGGKTLDLGAARYAHNLWLEVSYTAGFFPFILLVLFHALHGPAIARFFRNPPSVLSGMVVLSMLTAMFVACVVEPVLDASITYFTASCLVLGLIRQAAPAPVTESAPARARVTTGRRRRAPE